MTGVQTCALPISSPNTVLYGIATTTLASSTSIFVRPEASPPPSPLPTPEPEPPPVDILKVFSPLPNSKISGEKKLKIYIEGVHPSTYSATYNVDGRGEVLMQDAAPYKQAKVQFDDWMWNGDGPYRIIFTALGASGTVIDTELLTLFVRH